VGPTVGAGRGRPYTLRGRTTGAGARAFDDPRTRSVVRRAGVGGRSHLHRPRPGGSSRADSATSCGRNLSSSPATRPARMASSPSCPTCCRSSRRSRTITAPASSTGSRNGSPASAGPPVKAPPTTTSPSSTSKAVHCHRSTSPIRCGRAPLSPGSDGRAPPRVKSGCAFWSSEPWAMPRTTGRFRGTLDHVRPSDFNARKLR
jgi:hypothetical protein